MKGFFFEVDFLAVVIVLIYLFFLLVWINKEKKFSLPLLYFSNFTALKNNNNSTKIKYQNIPNHLGFLSFIFFLIAFVNPHVDKLKEDFLDSHEGIAIFLAIDHSGSMAKEGGAFFDKRHLSKLELAKEITAQFVEGRKNDLIGLSEFARSTKILVPLTLNHNSVLKKLKTIKPVEVKSEDSTAIGYAIYKIANVMEATKYYNEEGDAAHHYSIKSNVIILLTDGFQAVHPLDKSNFLRNISLEEAALQAREKGVKLYIINVDPNFSTEEFISHRNLMKKIAEITGGKFFLVEGNNTLNKIYQEIDTLEKSTFYSNADNEPHKYVRFSFYPIFIFLGLVTLFLSLGLKSTYFKEGI